MSANQIADVFAEWQASELNSYLIDITATILRKKDAETGSPLVDLVLDQAEQKGTGKWTVQLASDLGIAIPTIDAAIAARNISGRKAERVKASQQIETKTTAHYSSITNQFRDALRHALYASKVCAYAQGMALMKAGSDAFSWGIDLSEVGRIWQGGCIIRAAFLKRIKDAYLRTPRLENLLMDQEIGSTIAQAQSDWRIVVSVALQQGLPALAMSSSLGYFDMYRTASLPLNLTQAQRDFFGSHMYRRVDKPDLGPIHTAWDE
jgi:6-phosphogluconate dehydrogenase